MKRIQLFSAILLVAVPLSFLAAQSSSTGSTKKASTKKAASAEDKAKRPSPPAQATLKENGENVATIEYSSPRAKGRKIMGELVPYGKEWRTGANEATALTTTRDLKFGDKVVPKGSYTLYTIPGENDWTLIINKQTGQWGTDYNENQDFARVQMSVEKTSAPVENFTINFNGGKLIMEWENTRASVPVSSAK
jgi:hypothetical protein